MDLRLCCYVMNVAGLMNVIIAKNLILITNISAFYAAIIVVHKNSADAMWPLWFNAFSHNGFRYRTTGGNLKARFPQYNIARIDRDSTARKGKLKVI